MTNATTEQSSTPDTGDTSHDPYAPEGVTVRGGPAGFSRQVQSVSELNDADIIRVGDMDVTVSVARDLGLLGKVFDEGLNAGSASQHTDTPERQFQVVQKSETGHVEYDQAIDNLNAMINEGDMTAQEGQVYDTSLAQVAMAGLQVEHVVETINGLADGSVAEFDVPADVRKMASEVETNVRKASETAALNELGQQGFTQLGNLMDAHAGVADVVNRYAIDRMQGKHEGVTWAELYQDIHEQLGLA